jgi:hypothetical protein
MRFSNDLAYALSPSLWSAARLDFEADTIQRSILDGQGRRVLLNCHRQFGKSTAASILCLHRAIFHPGSLCLIVAPSLRQSSENFRRVTAFLERLDEPPQLSEDTKLSLTLANGSRVLSLPGGNDGATIRGFSSPAIIIEDEAARCSDDLYFALRPMLASNPGGRLILASTPFGQRGHFYQAWKTETGWTRIAVRASENPRISAAYLAEEKVAIGPWMYAQEFECEFVQTESQLLGVDMIQRALNPDIPIIEFGE